MKPFVKVVLAEKDINNYFKKASITNPKTYRPRYFSSFCRVPNYLIKIKQYITSKMSFLESMAYYINTGNVLEKLSNLFVTSATSRFCVIMHW